MKKWNFSKVVASFLLLGLGSNAFANYNITDRYVLTEDKFKTTEMLRPLGHDFLIDIGGWMSSNIQDIISDADDASKKSTATEQLNAANDLLAKYDNTEQILRVGVNFGIPLFSFTAWGVKIVPDIRVNANFGVQTKIGSEVCTFDTLVKIIGSQGLPASVENQITNALSGVTCSQIQASPQNGNLMNSINGTTTKHILLTIDVEDWFQVENFKPYIPFSSWPERELRVEQNTHRLLDLFDSVEVAGRLGDKKQLKAESQKKIQRTQNS